MYQICWFLPSIQFPQKYLYSQAHSIKNAFAVSYLAQFLELEKYFWHVGIQ